MSVFVFKQFEVKQADSAMKVGTDSVLLGALLKAGSPARILDIGTGTGLLALMMAQRFSPAQIDAVEIDVAAAAEAKFNFDQSKWSSRIQLLQQSFQQLSGLSVQYDLMVSNPPYYEAENQYAIPSHQRLVARHTELLSFDELLSGVRQHLSPIGICWMVLPKRESELVIQKAAGFHLYVQDQICVFAKKSKSYNRVIFSLQHTPCTPTVSDFVIYTEEGSYTQEYKEVTLPFLLWK